MKLVFLLQKNNYFVEHSKAWFRVDSDSDIALALRVLTLRVVDEFDLVEQPHQKGYACISAATDDAIGIEFFYPDGRLIERIESKIDQGCLAHVDWLNRQFRDGWVDAEAMLEITGAKEYSLRAYLPQVEGSQGKMLSIVNESGVVENQIFLRRDSETLVSIVEAAFEGKRQLTLRCEPEVIDSSTDIRQLGFVLVDENVAAA